MNEGQGKSFILLASIFVIVVVFLSLTDPPKNEEDKKWSPAYEKLETDSIDEIKIHHKGEQWQIKKFTERWKITSPIIALADTNRIENIIDSVKDLECGEKVGTNPKEFGLEPPKWDVQLKGNGSELANLQIGNDAIGYKTYVRCLKGIRLSRTQLSTSYRGGLTHLRYKKFFEGSAKQIDSIIFPDGSHAQKNENVWKFEAPARVNINQNKMKSWLEDVYNAEASDFLPAEIFSNPQQWVLASGEVQIDLKKQGNKVTTTLHKSDVLKVDSPKLAFLEQQSTVFYASILLLQNPVSFTIEMPHLPEPKRVNKIDDKWDDEGKLYELINQGKFIRSLGPEMKKQGTLTIQLAQNNSTVAFDISIVDAQGNRFLRYGEEDVNIQIPTALQQFLEE